MTLTSFLILSIYSIDLRANPSPCSEIERDSARLECFDSFFPNTKDSPCKSSEPKARISCFDSKYTETIKNEPIPQEKIEQERFERIATEVDKSVIKILKDPTSVIQYRVSNPVECPPAKCICFELNAKNSYGAYAGQTTFIAMLLDVSEMAAVISPREAKSPEDIAICASAQFTNRSSEKIITHISK